MQTSEIFISAKDAASKVVNGISGAFEKMRISVETNNRGINKLDNALRGMGAQAASLPGPLGRVADALADFAPGGLAGGAALAGLAAVALAFNRNKERQKELLESGRDLATALEQQRLAYIKSAQGVDAYNDALLRSNITLAQTAVQQATADLVKYEQEQRKAIDSRVRGLQQLNKVVAVGGGEGAGRTPVEQVNAEAVAISVRNRNLAESNKLLTALAEANARLSEAIAARNQTEIEKAKRSQEAAAKAIVDAEAARKKALQESITEYQQLFNLNAAGLPLTIQQQDILTSKIDEYRNAINDVTLSLEERQTALNAINQLESVIEKKRNDIAAAQKAREDEQKRRDKEQEDARKKRFDDAIKEQEQYLNNISTYTTAAADAFNLMFSVIGQGGDAFKNLGRGFAQLISGLARSKVAENIAYAVENLGKAFGNIAIGNLPGAAANKAAAASHFKAAALWGVLSGVGAAAGGAGAAGGGTGGAFNNSQLGRNNFSTQQPLTIVVQGGLLDMSNPDTQRSFVSAMETVSNRRVKISTVGM
jgi:hypothetical protein